MNQTKSENSILTLIADYIFFLLPFVILFIVRVAQGKSSDLILMSDWSIASTIVYGQLIVKLSSALASTNRDKKIPAITLYLTGLVCLGLVINVVVYVLMLIMPSVKIGIAQLILFVLASVCHFVFGSVVNHIKNTK